jgi:hypothetical protein
MVVVHIDILAQAMRILLEILEEALKIKRLIIIIILFTQKMGEEHCKAAVDDRRQHQPVFLFKQLTPYLEQFEIGLEKAPLART